MMSRDQQKAAIAQALPYFMAALSKAVGSTIGSDRHQVVIIIRAGDATQALANVDRKVAEGIVSEVLADWAARDGETPNGAGALPRTQTSEG